jgi:hypothetical protein
VAIPAVPPLPASPLAAITEETARPSYRERLAKIGGYLMASEARHVCVSELEEGYLLVYVHEDKQAVETLTYAEADALPKPSRGQPPTSLPQQLGAIGRYLDRNQALSILLDNQHGGYYVEYVAPPTAVHAAARLARTSRFLDESAMRQLMVPTGMLARDV